MAGAIRSESERLPAEIALIVHQRLVRIGRELVAMVLASLLADDVRARRSALVGCSGVC